VMKVKGRRCRFTEDDLPETAENRHRRFQTNPASAC